MIEIFREQPLILLIPLISAFVGWFTNVLAIRMMFQPTDFVGIRPFLGWQGIIPANARKLARASTALMTEKLLRLPALLAEFEPSRFVAEVDSVVQEVGEEIVAEVERGPLAAMWKALGDDAKAQVRALVGEEVRQVAVHILADLRDHIEELLDLSAVVEETVARDKAVVSEMFATIGSEEFRFIERSGIWFGFAFGLVQMLVWALWPSVWILPLAGFGVGFATNWLAIKMIFEPRHPRRVGPVTVHGLFHKRQNEVTTEFAHMVTSRVFTPENLVSTMTTGARRDRLIALIRGRVVEAIDRYADHPMAKMAPASLRTEMEELALERLEERLDAEGGFLHVFAEKSVNIKGRLVDQMSQMDPESFEGVLRPAFQEEEWKLILAGAALGLGAGVLQVVYLFGEKVIA